VAMANDLGGSIKLREMEQQRKIKAREMDFKDSMAEVDLLKSRKENVGGRGKKALERLRKASVMRSSFASVKSK